MGKNNQTNYFNEELYLHCYFMPDDDCLHPTRCPGCHYIFSRQMHEWQQCSSSRSNNSPCSDHRCIRRYGKKKTFTKEKVGNNGSCLYISLQLSHWRSRNATSSRK